MNELIHKLEIKRKKGRQVRKRGKTSHMYNVDKGIKAWSHLAYLTRIHHRIYYWQSSLKGKGNKGR